MYGLIDLPSPFAPIPELQESLRTLAKLPQDDPQVKDAQAQVRRYLAEREDLRKSASRSKRMTSLPPHRT